MVLIPLCVRARVLIEALRRLQSLHWLLPRRRWAPPSSLFNHLLLLFLLLRGAEPLLFLLLRGAERVLLLAQRSCSQSSFAAPAAFVCTLCLRICSKAWLSFLSHQSGELHENMTGLATPGQLSGLREHVLFMINLSQSIYVYYWRTWYAREFSSKLR